MPSVAEDEKESVMSEIEVKVNMVDSRLTESIDLTKDSILRNGGTIDD
jgi:hypothetical protein